MTMREEMESAHFKINDEIIKLQSLIKHHMDKPGFEHRYHALFSELDRSSTHDGGIIVQVDEDLRQARADAKQDRYVRAA